MQEHHPLPKANEDRDSNTVILIFPGDGQERDQGTTKTRALGFSQGPPGKLISSGSGALVRVCAFQLLGFPSQFEVPPLQVFNGPAHRFPSPCCTILEPV